MITPKQAEKRIAGLSTDQVRGLTVRRILGKDTAPIGSRHLDEPSEDVVIQLLRKDDLQEEARRAVIAGCELVYSRLLAWLAAPDHSGGGEDLAEAASRLCRVVDVAEPNELRGHADAMLNLALSATVLPSGVLAAAVRAGMAFGCTPEHVPVWEQVLEREEVAAYAFSALLAIDPQADRVANALAHLWQKQLCSKWNVDTEFLARKAARLSGSDEVIMHALFALDRDLAAQPVGKDLKAKLLKNLAGRSWSQGWIAYLPQEKTAMGNEVLVARSSSSTFDYGLQDFYDYGLRDSNAMWQKCFWTEEGFATKHSRVPKAVIEHPTSGERFGIPSKGTTLSRWFGFTPEIPLHERIHDFSQDLNANEPAGSLGAPSWKNVRRRLGELRRAKGTVRVLIPENLKAQRSSTSQVYYIAKQTRILRLRHS